MDEFATTPSRQNDPAQATEAPQDAAAHLSSASADKNLDASAAAPEPVYGEVAGVRSIYWEDPTPHPGEVQAGAPAGDSGDTEKDGNNSRSDAAAGPGEDTIGHADKERTPLTRPASRFAYAPRRQRRESALDVRARTERRPRPWMEPVATEASQYSTQQELSGDRSPVPENRSEELSEEAGSDALMERRSRPRSVVSAEPAAGEERPAWLVGSSLPDDRGDEPEDRAEDTEIPAIEGSQRERDAFDDFLAQSAEPSPLSNRDDGSHSGEKHSNDGHSRDAGVATDSPEPMFIQASDRPDRSAEGVSNLDSRRERKPLDISSPTPVGGAYHEEIEEQSFAPDVSSSATAPAGVMSAGRNPAASDGPIALSAVESFRDRRKSVPYTEGAGGSSGGERRRFARSASGGGFEMQLDVTGEYRGTARFHDPEMTDRIRLQKVRHEVEPRESFRNPARGAEELTRNPAASAVLADVIAPRIPDTLQQSQERVAARWFALKSLMGSQVEPAQEAAPPSRTAKETGAPTLSVVALAGGVGKTSLVATLGRVLSSLGEKVLLAEATAYGLLPYYFGARELRADIVRTFSPPDGSTDAPVFLVNYQAELLASDDAGQARLAEDIGQHGSGAQRILLDLNGSSAWLARRLAQVNSNILVPVLPDMNSVLGIKGVERFFAGIQDSEGRTVTPYYVLNQFDASLPLHLDVREVLRKQLGNRLLPVTIRRSHAVSEALAEGMTVADYAPGSPVTEDYTHLAEWVRNLAAPADAGVQRTRWSER